MKTERRYIGKTVVSKKYRFKAQFKVPFGQLPDDFRDLVLNKNRVPQVNQQLYTRKELVDLGRGSVQQINEMLQGLACAKRRSEILPRPSATDACCPGVLNFSVDPSSGPPGFF